MYMFTLRSGNGHWWPILSEKSSKGPHILMYAQVYFRKFFPQTRLTIDRLCQFKYPRER